MAEAEYRWTVTNQALSAFVAKLDANRKVLVQIDFFDWDDDGEAVWTVTVRGNTKRVVHLYLGFTP